MSKNGTYEVGELVLAAHLLLLPYQRKKYDNHCQPFSSLVLFWNPHSPAWRRPAPSNSELDRGKRTDLLQLGTDSWYILRSWSWSSNFCRIRPDFRGCIFCSSKMNVWKSQQCGRWSHFACSDIWSSWWKNGRAGEFEIDNLEDEFESDAAESLQLDQRLDECTKRP